MWIDRGAAVATANVEAAVCKWYPKRTFGDLLDDAVEKWGQQEALYHEGRRWSFSELRNEVDTIARGLIALGVEPGEKVALWMPNRPEWIFAFFAISKIGAVVVPVNTRFRSVDLEYVLRQSDSRTLLTVDHSGPIDYLTLAREVIPEITNGTPQSFRTKEFPELRRVVVLGDEQSSATVAWSNMLHQGANVDPDELQQLCEDVESRQHNFDDVHIGHHRVSERRDALTYHPAKSRRYREPSWLSK